ncbi:hypothetical protein [Staphylococcus aureus]|nr:hypothetical protein [Staphylococcus aureus]
MKVIYHWDFYALLGF